MPCQLLFCISSICPRMIWFIFLVLFHDFIKNALFHIYFYLKSYCILYWGLTVTRRNKCFIHEKAFLPLFWMRKMFVFSLKSRELKENGSWASYSNLMLEGICQFQFRFITSPFLWVDTLKRLIIAIYVMLHLRFIY